MRKDDVLPQLVKNIKQIRFNIPKESKNGLERKTLRELLLLRKFREM